MADRYDEEELEMEDTVAGLPAMPVAPPIDALPGDWNLTTVAPPANYNVVKPGLGFHDFYNLRRPKVAEGEETAEMRNMQAWRDANYRLPLDAIRPIPKHKVVDWNWPIYEFATGFFFGSIFSAIWNGPLALRFFRKLRRGEVPAYNRMRFGQKVLMYAKYARRMARIPLLFAVFQLLLRGINPMFEGYTVPWIVGVSLIGLNHMRRLPRRMRWYRYWNRYRSLGNIHALEHRSILQGSLRRKWATWARAYPAWFRRRIWRGMLIIFIIEAIILPYYNEGRKFGEQFLTRGLKSFGILASPTFGPDPPEIIDRNPLKRPEVPMPRVDGSSWWTHWFWKNNSPRSGNAYVPDERMFSLPDLRPILDDGSSQNAVGKSSPRAGGEQLLKYDDTALRALDHTPAFYLGQQDWRNDNKPTGRHEYLVRAGALDDGRYVLQRICLETLTQQMVDNDPRWVDPAWTDIAASLIDKAAEDERVYGQIVSGKILTDPWEEAPHVPLILKDWNRREKRAADEMIKARHWNASNSGLWAFLERLYDSKHSPVPATYSIDDGPGGYHNISDREMDERRNYVLNIDPRPIPEKLEIGSGPSHFLKRLFWKYKSGLDTPPGLPKPLDTRFAVYTPPSSL